MVDVPVTVGFGAVRAWQSTALADAAATPSAAVQLLGEVVDGLSSAAAETSAWQGAAAAGARARQDALLLRAVHLAETASGLDASLRRAAVMVATVADLARHAAVLADLRGVVIADNGQLVDATGIPGVHHLEIELLVSQASAEAARADDILTAALATARGAAVGLPACRPTVPPPPGDHPAPVPAVPPCAAAGVRAWWDGLSAQERLAAVAAHPDVIGATDGLPSWARDQANRVRLALAEHDLLQEADRLRPPTSGGVAGGLAGAATVGTMDGPTRRAAYLQVQAKLAAVRATEQVLDQPGARQRQLLVLDLTGRSAKVAVAVGDADRAEHVAVVVPGFTTTVQRDLPGAAHVADDLADVARRESMARRGRGDVAVVTWIGYDAPQVADTFRSHSVVRRESAEAGAASLATFLRGMPPQTHLTLVGHSYGSTTAGLAVAAGGTGVSDLVALGSPGLGVSATAQLGMPAARVHVLEADDDPVADLAWFGRDPGHLAGVDRPSTETAVLGDGSLGARAVGHSSYLARGTTSQWNVAAVVAGVPTVSSRRRASW